MQSLPLDVIKEIFIICPIKTLRRLILVNKQFAQISEDNYIWQQKLVNFPTEAHDFNTYKFLYSGLIFPISYSFSNNPFVVFTRQKALTRKYNSYYTLAESGIIRNIMIQINKRSETKATIYDLIDRISIRSTFLYQAEIEHLQSQFVCSAKSSLSNSDRIYYPLLIMREHYLGLPEDTKICVELNPIFADHITNIRFFLTYCQTQN